MAPKGQKPKIDAWINALYIIHDLMLICHVATSLKTPFMVATH